MKKIILIGRSGSGKSTLVQVINKEEIIYKKTQAMEYVNSILDTPGEYLENPRLYSALITASYDCDIIGLIMDCTDERSLYPPNFASIFNKPSIGIITKTDLQTSSINWYKESLYLAGVDKIFEVSSFNKKGLNTLKNYLKNK